MWDIESSNVAAQASDEKLSLQEFVRILCQKSADWIKRKFNEVVEYFTKQSLASNEQSQAKEFAQ